MSAMIRPTEPAPIRACTVSRDVQSFEFLIDDMEAALGEAWGDLSFQDMLAFFDQPAAQSLEFIVLAMREDDIDEMEDARAVVMEAGARDIGVILVAADLDPVSLHHVMRAGAKEFLPYPVPEGGLADAIERVLAPPTPLAPAQAPVMLRPDTGRTSTVLAVHGLAGGVGATTFAMNLAWELASRKKDAPSVVLIDLDLQFGEVATYLDMPRRDTIYEFLSDVGTADTEAFGQALLEFGGKLKVFTAPADVLPLDLVGQEDIAHLLELAKSTFDIVVVEMPRTLVGWTETVLQASDVYFTLVELDMRSAQNTLRFLKTLKAEDLPTEQLRFVLNRAPKFTDLTGRSRIKRMADSLDIQINDLLSDGGRAVMEASDQGLPLAESAPKNPMRREIGKIAQGIFDQHSAAVAAAKA